jgi:pimeloyl-ACP methyl ester carboxylesterase
MVLPCGKSSPIILGASFGGMVALAYATRHPAHPSKLVLISTEAAGGTHRDRRVALFERFGGPEVGALARRRFLELQGHDEASLEAWRNLAFPLYTRTPRDPDMARRAVSRSAVLQWFTKPGGESLTFNMFPELHRIQCPVLVLGGEDDPIHPIESQADIAAALPAHLVQFERFANCGHGVVPDAPERAMAVIRDFIGHR